MKLMLEPSVRKPTAREGGYSPNLVAPGVATGYAAIGVPVL
jgi:hypothetical protein